MRADIETELIFEAVSARHSGAALLGISTDTALKNKIVSALKNLKKKALIDFFAELPLDPTRPESVYLTDKFPDAPANGDSGADILFWIKV